MIDTISITIPQDRFIIIDHDRFSPSTENLFKPPYIRVTGKAPFISKNNPTQALKDKYGYMPRLTLIKALRRGGFQIFLKIEFSIPKLLFGNNFDELDDNDFHSICERLKSKLFNMGVIVKDLEYLKNAQVSTIHYSKNIILTNYGTPYTYLQELRKVNINMLQDINQAQYRGSGHSFKLHSNHFEIIFYDKLADLEKARKSEKRAIENDNYTQLSLFNTKPVKRPFEVLRIEIRLGNRKKIKQVMEKNDLQIEELSFSNLFSKDISKKIISSMINEIYDQYIPVLQGRDSVENIFNSILLNNPEISLNQLLKSIGATAIIKEIGIRDFRKRISKYGNSSWYRLNKLLKDIEVENKDNIFDFLKEQIVEFKKVSLKEYEERKAI